ncbi:hypothetical protein TcBrA4_0112980 [Trypanosoma cruzi]|nr:hypothetical protein TcBrA4_0112980 [Trypanosoma cruzi]
MGRQLGDHQHSARRVTNLHRFCHGKLECFPYGRDNRKILQVHDVPEEVELLLGTQGPRRGIRGRWGFVQRIAVAPFDGRIGMHDGRNGLATAPGCVLGHLADAGAPVPAMQTAVRGTVRLGGAPFAEEEMLYGIVQLSGATAYTQSHGSSGQWNNDAGVGVQDIQRAIRGPRNGATHSPRAFQRAKKEHAASTPNEARCRKRGWTGQHNTACRVKLQKEAYRHTQKGSSAPEAMTSGPAAGWDIVIKCTGCSPLGMGSSTLRSW